MYIIHTSVISHENKDIIVLMQDFYKCIFHYFIIYYKITHVLQDSCCLLTTRHFAHVIVPLYQLLCSYY